MKYWHKLLLILVIGIGGCIFVLVFINIISYFSSFQPISTEPKYLWLRLSGDIQENTSRDSFSELFLEAHPTILRYVLGIHHAKNDQSIAGLIIQPQNLQIGWAKTQEFREALMDFKKSGKKLIAHLEYASTRDYYLASVCDKIFIVPHGLLNLLGLTAEMTFLKDGLDKLGIKASYINIGRYKTATDTYTRNNMSSSHREMVTTLLDDYYDQLVNDLAVSRAKTKNQLVQLINNGPYSASQAFKAGLIDSLIYWDQVKKLLGSTEENSSIISFSEYLSSPRPQTAIDGREKIAFIFAQGTIASGGHGYSPIYGDITGSYTLSRYIRRAVNDNSVKAIVLRIDSPGGSGMAADIIWREVLLARRKKPFIVSMSDVAASGGYYIAMAADSVIAHPMTITGSIGVFSGKFNMKGFYEKLGIKKEEMRRGQHANLFSDYRDFTEQEKKIIEHNLQDFYDNFIEKVSENRNKSAAEINKSAQGRVWSGYRAKQLGLVDTLGSLITAFKMAKRMANIPENESVRIIIYPEKKTLLERLIAKQLNFMHTQLALYLPSHYFRFTQIEHQLFTNGETLALMPYYLNIK